MSLMQWASFHGSLNFLRLYQSAILQLDFDQSTFLEGWKVMSMVKLRTITLPCEDILQMSWLSAKSFREFGEDSQKSILRCGKKNNITVFKVEDFIDV